MYRMVNRRGGASGWASFHTDDGLVRKEFGEGHFAKPGGIGPPIPISGGYGKVESDSVVTVELDRPEVLMFISGAVTVGPWTVRSRHHLVITPNNGAQILVSVEEALVELNRRLSATPRSGQERAADREAIDVVVEIGKALMQGLASGISGTIPGTGLILEPMSAVMTTVYGMQGQEPPAPPDLDQIEHAISVAVKGALHEHDAVRAANVIAQNIEWFAHLGKVIAGHVRRQEPVPRHLIADASSNLEQALNPADDGSFINQLAYVSHHPDVAAYVLPEYTAGIGLGLHLLRVHLGEIYGKGADGSAAIPVEEIEAIRDFAVRHSRGLENAIGAYDRMRQGLVSSTGLQGTPEAIAAIRLIDAHYLGRRDARPDRTYAAAHPNGSDFIRAKGYAQDALKPDSFDRGLAVLNGVIEALEADLKDAEAGQQPTRYPPSRPASPVPK